MSFYFHNCSQTLTRASNRNFVAWINKFFIVQNNHLVDDFCFQIGEGIQHYHPKSTSKWFALLQLSASVWPLRQAKTIVLLAIFQVYFIWPCVASHVITSLLFLQTFGKNWPTGSKKSKIKLEWPYAHQSQVDHSYFSLTSYRTGWLFCSVQRILTLHRSVQQW